MFVVFGVRFTFMAVGATRLESVLLACEKTFDLGAKEINTSNELMSAIFLMAIRFNS